MSRVQLALNVNDVDDAVAFYSKLFGTAPARLVPQQPGPVSAGASKVGLSARTV